MSLIPRAHCRIRALLILLPTPIVVPQKSNFSGSSKAAGDTDYLTVVLLRGVRIPSIEGNKNESPHRGIKTGSETP